MHLSHQKRASDTKGLTVVNQRKWVFMYERLVKEVSVSSCPFSSTVYTLTFVAHTISGYMAVDRGSFVYDTPIAYGV